MDWQQPASLLIVAVSAFFLLRHEVKKRRRAKQKACGGDCGCSSDVLEKIKAESPAVSHLNTPAVK